MRQQLLGIEVDNLSMTETLDRVEQFVRSGRPHQHVVVNADKVVKAARDPALRQIISSCDLISADGMPVVWASWLLRPPLKQRVTGIDLFFKLLERAEECGWRVYFLGARKEVLDRVLERARRDYPQLAVAGSRDGYWKPDEEHAVAKEIASVRPHLLFVAISSPKKEEFLNRWRDTMKVPFAMGVGGTFDVMAGLTKRAPMLMQKLGFEWFYRFLQEPRRMFRRYFIDDMQFFWLLTREVALRAFARSRPSA